MELVTSDAHQWLKNAIAAVFAGAGWQHSRTIMANLLIRVPKGSLPSSPKGCGGHFGTHHLPATVFRRGPRPTGPSGGITPGAFSLGGRAAGGRRAGHLGLHGLPSGPLAEALVQRDPEGTAEPGNPASQSLPWYGTWWAYPPTDSRRSVWWARCWPSSMTSRPKPADFGTHPGANHQRRKQSGQTGDAEEH